jgi:prepilin-type processing-associated H-X9-DG protein
MDITFPARITKPSIGMNSFLGFYFNWWYYSSFVPSGQQELPGNARPVSDSIVQYPAATVVLCDAFDRTVNGTTPRPYWIDSGYGKGVRYGLSDRHSQGTNCTFWDGHAKWYKTNSVLNQMAIDTAANTYIEMTNYNRAGVIWDVDADNQITRPGKYPLDCCRN